MDAPIQVHTLVTGAFVENGYILHREGSPEAILIDPGAEPQTWLTQLDKRGLRPVLILATHAHLDHVGAIAGIQQAHEAPLRLHEDEQQVLDTLDWQCELFSMPKIDPPQVDRPITDGEKIEAAGIRLHAIATPGHTPGGTCYHVPEIDRVFTGDTLFDGTVGRTDLPGGDSAQLVSSLTRLCKTLPDETIVLPGHGPTTTIKKERTTNPFFRAER
jgi:hydroxyacylglutathione hydrolase